jgi:hypothetical protein
MTKSKEGALVTVTLNLRETIIILQYRPEAMSHAHNSISLCMLIVSLDRIREGHQIL